MWIRVVELFGVEFLICVFSYCWDVVVVVFNVGGFGIFGVVVYSFKWLESELIWIEEYMGGKLYGVDVLLLFKYIGVE